MKILISLQYPIMSVFSLPWANYDLLDLMINAMVSKNIISSLYFAIWSASVTIFCLRYNLSRFCKLKINIG